SDPAPDPPQPRALGGKAPGAGGQPDPPVGPAKRSGPHRPLRHPAHHPGRPTPATHPPTRPARLHLAPNGAGHRRTSGPDPPLRNRRHRPLPQREGLPELLPPGQRDGGQRQTFWMTICLEDGVVDVAAIAIPEISARSQLRLHIDLRYFDVNRELLLIKISSDAGRFAVFAIHILNGFVLKY